ncbi:hypothetical protein [Flavobacterium anhuiense]|uniref:hypothetical protein n=1 Tax=Flavobacterium anhuiense TaxID=459526 RepID=UPI003D98977F
MNISEYFNKIEALQEGKSIILQANYADLEFCIQKIKNIRAVRTFSLDALRSKENLENNVLNKDIINKFSGHLGLLFLEEQESGNVCFANNDEVRPEYRQSFKLIDLLDYIYAYMHSSFFNESQNIILTSDTNLFWKLVRIGSGFRKQNI